MKNLLVVLLVVGTLVGCGKKTIEETDLPSIPVSLLSGETIDAKSIEGKTILIFFQPDCDHCQHEAEDISENLDLFEDYQLYFISSSSPEEVQAFAKTYRLDNANNVIFATSPSEKVIDALGFSQVPAIYLYDEDGLLTKSFEGQVGINELSEAL